MTNNLVTVNQIMLSFGLKFSVRMAVFIGHAFAHGASLDECFLCNATSTVLRGSGRHTGGEALRMPLR